MRHGHSDHERGHRGGRGRHADGGRDDEARHHRSGRGGRHGRRLFDHGELRLVVLSLIAEQPRHGYEIIKEIEDRTGGAYSPSPGVIYPTLTMLEEIGQATVAEDGGKKLYAVTADGTDHLAAHRQAVEGAMGRMRAAAGDAHDAAPPEIVRATENLKLALRLRRERGPLTPEQARAVADALDAAAVAIERS